MKKNECFVDVLLPIPVDRIFTYHCTENQFNKIQKGARIAVPFGKQKVQTAIVWEKHRRKPAFQTKPVLEILDTYPVINEYLFQIFDFVHRYYLASFGKILRLALPKSFLLESETLFALTGNSFDKNVFDDNTFLIVEALEKAGFLKVEEAGKIIGSQRKAVKILNRLLEQKIVGLHYEIIEKYKPKFISYIDLIDNEKSPADYINLISPRAKKQRELFLYFIQLYLPAKSPVPKKKLTEKFSSNLVKELINKQIFKELQVPIDRQVFDEFTAGEVRLNEAQNLALEQIHKALKENQPVLLHGVTASGKTELYIKLIEQSLKENKQVLYLVPEIGLTTQLVNRLKKHFGNKTAVYHSKYSSAARREIWKHAIRGDTQASLIIGTRSAIFVPMKNLGLIIIDEEHDESYKEYQHEPMYHARDLAVVISKLFKVPLVLGSATPSFDSYYNSLTGKYQTVRLKEKYHNTPEPVKRILDFKQAYKEGRVRQDFIKETLENIELTAKNKLQTLVFINKKGYAPIVTCKTCGYTENCPNCSVSLTYHKYEGKLKCHYCGYTIPKTHVCRACGSPELSVQGTGTEKIESQLKEFFPDLKIARMDSVTTAGRNKTAKLITDFENGKIDILVGTQMLTKGLDFARVGLVVVVNADRLIYFPEFRAHERAFQMLVQVAGRTGRRNRKDTVIVQTFQPEHPVLKNFLNNDYEAMFRQEMQERKLFKYPPFFRLILLEIKSKNPQNLHEAGNWLKNALCYYFQNVLGPSEPVVYKIRNYYHLEILIKLHAEKSTMKAREIIKKIIQKFESIGQFKNVKTKINVDPS